MINSREAFRVVALALVLGFVVIIANGAVAKLSKQIAR